MGMTESNTLIEGGAMNDRQFMNMVDTRYRMIYPTPFFDPIAMQTVADPKILMQWSRFFYDSHPIIHAAINKMVSYPITDFIFDTTDPKLKANYEAVFKTLNVRSLMVRAGLDYQVCGNAYMSFIMPFKRMFKCPECGYSSSAEASVIKPSATKLSMVCNHCSKNVEPTIEDANTQNTNDMKILLWNPMNMQTDYDEVMDTHEYYYSLPHSIKAGILKGEKKYISKYPLYFIKAAHEKKLIKFFSNKVLHIKRETHSAAYNKGLGQPLTAPVLKYLFHLLVLLRAQDALAIDQILPWTVISPSVNGGTDPASDMDLGGWRDQVNKEYEAWKKNPLRKSFMPVPMTAQIVGAQGKALMLTPEIEAITNQVLAGMGIPQEFVYGGLQWSGASVSLRMLENQFINFRTMMQRMLDWIVEQISVYFGYAPINVKFQDFKMADDVAQKQLIMSLAQAGIISNETMLQEIMPEIDYTKEQKRIEEEQRNKIKQQSDLATSQAAGNFAMQSQSQAQGLGAGGSQAGDNSQQNPPRGQGGNKQI